MSKIPGPMGDQITRFIAHKRAVGYVYDAEERELESFARFAAKRGDAQLTESLVREFVLTRKPKSRSNMVCLLRQLGVFLSAENADTFVAPRRYLGVARMPKPSIRVFTRTEILLLLQAFSSLPDLPPGAHRRLVYGAALRTLLFTGLRRGELCALRELDVDLDAAVLTIRKGKFGKPRIVPISKDLAARLRAYRNELNARIPGRSAADAFFPGMDGREPCRGHVLYTAFRAALPLAGMEHGGRGEGPRLHDLRHTFAVMRLLSWYEQDASMHAKLPLLSTYLGHIGVETSQTYLHMTVEMAQEVTRRYATRFGHLVTEGPSA